MAASAERFDLSARCPRLAAAYRGRLVEIALEREARRRARDRHTRAERLVAHRELQLIRAGWTGDPRYIVRREAKLARAVIELAHAEQALASVA